MKYKKIKIDPNIIFPISSVLVAAFFIRIFSLRLIPFNDESQLVYFPKIFTIRESLAVQFQPPFFELLTRAIYYLFGTESSLFRLIFIIFGMLGIYFTYALCRELYGRRTALISSIIIAFSFWHFVASTQIERDGAILALFYVLTIYCYLKYESTLKAKWTVLAGLSLGMALLTKTSAILLFPIIGFYSLIKTRNLITTIKDTIVPFIIGISFILLYLLAAYILSPKLLFDTINYGASRLTQINYMIIFYFLIWATPLLAISLLSLINFQKEDSILWLWVIFPIAVYSFTDSLAPIDRYLMVIIPPLAILSAKSISQFRFRKSHLLYYMPISIVYFCLLYLINQKANFIAHDIPKYFQHISNLDFNFLFPITGPAGPTFYVSFACIISSIILGGFLLFILFLFSVQHKNKRALIWLNLFLAIMLSYNLFLIKEMVFPSTIDTTNATNDVIAYMEEKKIDYLFTNTGSLIFYLNMPIEKEFNVLHYYDNLDAYKKELYEHGGWAAIIEYPKVDEKVLKLFNECKLDKEFIDKKLIVARIWDCHNLKK